MNINIMKSHFIEGTDKQYSIREDGKVFRNYKFSNRNKKLPIKRELKASAVINKTCHEPRLVVRLYMGNPKKRKTFTIKSLVAKYFNISNYIENATNIYHIDGNYNNCHRNNLAYKPFWNRKYESLKQKERRARDVEKYRAMGRKSDKKSTDNIDKRYMAKSLNIKSSEITDEMHELYKKTLTFKRVLAKEHNVHIRSFNQ